MSKLTLAGFILPLLLLFPAFETRSGNPASYRAPAANGVPRPDHVVIVIEENHSYSEIIGSSACTSGAYVRRHAPWVNFTNIPTTTNLPYSYFPTDYNTLPTLSFVIP